MDIYIFVCNGKDYQGKQIFQCDFVFQFKNNQLKTSDKAYGVKIKKNSDLFLPLFLAAMSS